MNLLPTVTSATLAAAAIAMTTATPANIVGGTAGIYLKPGKWLILGTLVSVAAAGTTVTSIQGGISATSATLPTTDTGLTALAGTLTTAGTESLAISPVFYISPPGGSNIWLVGQAAFGTSTLGMSGNVIAFILQD